jgi:hypothetical protein
LAPIAEDPGDEQVLEAVLSFQQFIDGNDQYAMPSEDLGTDLDDDMDYADENTESDGDSQGESEIEYEGQEKSSPFIVQARKRSGPKPSSHKRDADGGGLDDEDDPHTCGIFHCLLFVIFNHNIYFL